MKVDLNSLTRRFILGESRENINPHALLESLNEILSNVKVSRKVDHNRLHLGKRHIKEIKRSIKKLQEQVNVLQEKLQVLEEVSTVSGGGLAGHVDNQVVKRKRSND